MLENLNFFSLNKSMNQIILDDIDILKDYLNKHKDIILLNKLEKEMEDDDEVKILSYKFDMAQIAYSDSLKHNKIDNNQLFKNMINAYKLLNDHPKVKTYNNQYEKVKKIYDYINNYLFDFVKD